jgi:hypothetical protein
MAGGVCRREGGQGPAWAALVLPCVGTTRDAALFVKRGLP